MQYSENLRPQTTKLVALLGIDSSPFLHVEGTRAITAWQGLQRQKEEKTMDMWRLFLRFAVESEEF